VGIDFEPRSFRMLQVREQRDGLGVVGAAFGELPRSADADAVADQVRHAYAAGGFGGRRCAVSLPRSALRVQAVRLPAMPAEELRQAVEWEASQRFGLDRGAMEVDFVRTGALAHSGESREEVLVIALPHVAIDDRVEPLLAAGLRPIAVDTAFSALARAFGRRYRRTTDRDTVRMVVEVEASGSTVMILRGDQIALCKPISIGGDALDLAVAEHLQMEPKAAAELRAARLAEAGAAGAPAADRVSAARAVYEAVRPLLADLVKEVVLCQRYYGVTFRGQPPEQIILTGRDGAEPRLDEMLVQACQTAVAHDDSAKTLGGLAPRIRRAVPAPLPPSAWAAALGLSLRGARRRGELPAGWRAAA
jgi:type IV pilus assembly protein PilM